MAPTRRKKPDKQSKRPSVAKKGHAVARPAVPEEGRPTRTAVPERTKEAQTLVPQEAPSTQEAAPGGALDGADAVRAAGSEGFLAVDLADGALYSGSQLSAEDFSQQEDRVGEDPLAAGGDASAAAMAEKSVSDENPPAAAPTEVTDEERAAFYSAVPQQRSEESREGDSGRSDRGGKAAVRALASKLGGVQAKAQAKGTTARGARRAKGTDRPRKVSAGFVVKAVIIAVLVLAIGLGVAAVVAFNHVRDGGNDAQDFLGTWYLNGTNVPVEVTTDKIVLTSDVAYDYQLDVADKTIQLEFGSLKGGGRYLFSLDRQQLMIVDGETGGPEALLSDFAWTLQALIAQMRGDDQYPLPQMDDATYLNRAPAPGKAVTDDSADAGKALISGDNDSAAGGDGE